MDGWVNGWVVPECLPSYILSIENNVQPIFVG